MKRSPPQVFVWRVLAAGPLLWQVILLPKQTHSLFLTPYTHTHVNTHISLADSTQWHDCICSIKQASANRPAELIVTQHRGTQALSRVQPPTNFAMQRESADEVCQHASLTPDSQKTTGNRRAPLFMVGRGQRRRGEE